MRISSVLGSRYSRWLTIILRLWMISMIGSLMMKTRIRRRKVSIRKKTWSKMKRINYS